MYFKLSPNFLGEIYYKFYYKLYYKLYYIVKQQCTNIHTLALAVHLLCLVFKLS